MSPLTRDQPYPLTPHPSPTQASSHSTALALTSHRACSPPFSNKEPDPKVESKLEVEIKVTVKFVAKFTVMLGLWADYSPSNSWLISSATAEASLEVAIIATLKADFHLLASTHLGGTEGPDSTLYPLVLDKNIRGQKPALCSDVDAKPYISAHSLKSRTCGARLKELMANGMGEYNARKKMYEETAKTQCSAGPEGSLCAKRYASDYFYTSEACKAPHNIQLDFFLEFALEAKVSLLLT